MSFKSFFKYLNSSSRDVAWGIYCNDVGAVEIKAGEPYPYQANLHPPQYSKNWERGRILPEFQFVYIAQGKGSFRTAKSSAELHAGSFIVLVPGVWHWYHPDVATGWIEYWVGFEGDYPQLLRERGFLGLEPTILEAGEHEAIIGLYNRILDGVQAEKPGYQQIISSVIPLLYSEVISYARQSEIAPTKKELFDKIIFILRSNIYSSIDMESLVQNLNLNYDSFREDFKAYTGLSPYQYFLQMKINKAKELLSDGSLSVKEISYKLSFDNPYYFSRLFKKKTGVSPSQWNGLETSEG